MTDLNCLIVWKNMTPFHVSLPQHEKVRLQSFVHVVLMKLDLDHLDAVLRCEIVPLISFYSEEETFTLK